MMFMQIKRRLRDRTVVTAAILSLVGCSAATAGETGQMGGRHDHDQDTVSPIKHVIVIMGENRTFDHVFATYQPRQGEQVDNLLSRGIVNKDGSPGPNYGKAAQFSAVDNHFFSINPGQKKSYNNNSNKLQAPGTSYAPQACYPDVATADINGPGCMASLAWAAQADYGLLPQDLPLLTTGAAGL